jgi:hypothetical protein
MARDLPWIYYNSPSIIAGLSGLRVVPTFADVVHLGGDTFPITPDPIKDENNVAIESDDGYEEEVVEDNGDEEAIVGPVSLLAPIP